MLYFPSFMSQRGTYAGAPSSPTASPSFPAPGTSSEEVNMICYQQPDQLGRNSYHVLHKLVHPPAVEPEYPHHHHHHHHQHRQHAPMSPRSQRLTLAPTTGAFAALDGLVLPESSAFRTPPPATTAPSSTTQSSSALGPLPGVVYPGVAGTNQLYAAALRHQQSQRPSSSSCSSAASPEGRRQARRKRPRQQEKTSGASSPFQEATPTWQRRQQQQQQQQQQQHQQQTPQQQQQWAESPKPPKRTPSRPTFSLGPPQPSSDEPSPAPASVAASASATPGTVRCSATCRAENIGLPGGDAFCTRTSEMMPPCPDSPPDHDCQKLGCERITLNVSGMYFETRRGILERHPSTLLGNSDKRLPYFDAERREYFFDRHRPTFEAIFNYYQYGGKIKRPNHVPDDIFLSELEFYEIEKEVIDTYKRDEGYVIENVVLPENPFKRRVWMLFEYPETSTTAFFIAVSSVIFTVISIILFCVETLPVFADSHCVSGEAPNFLDPFFIVESMCTFWFTLEVIVRFFVCPSVKAYMKDLKNAVDLAAIVPYYVTLFNVLLSFSCEGAKGSASLAFLRVIRLIRVFKLTKHSAGLQVLVLTFRASIEGLSLFLVALIVCILVFSSTIYYVEADNKNSSIESIPDAFWWAIITMCTVGYGDKVPKGPLGKLVGGCCALAGVLTLAIPVPIITENFNKFYTHKTGRGKH